MKLPKELTTVTSTSKTLALIMLISLPALGFIYGKNYQKNIQDAQIIRKNDSELFNQTNVLSPTPSPIQEANWLLFKNDELGISFEYPKEWHEPSVTKENTKTVIEFRDGQETQDNTIAPKFTITKQTSYRKADLSLREYIEQSTPPDKTLEQYEAVYDYSGPPTSPQLVGKIYTHTARSGMGNWITEAFLAQNMGSPLITTLYFRYDNVRSSDERIPPMDPVFEHILQTLAVVSYQGK